jgi:hypothetical protein
VVKRPVKPPYPLVYVEWDDSYGCTSHWRRIDDPFPAPDPIICRSVGWLVHDGKGHKVVVPHLAQPVDDHWDGMGELTIPTAAVLKLTHLRR